MVPEYALQFLAHHSRKEFKKETSRVWRSITISKPMKMTTFASSIYFINPKDKVLFSIWCQIVRCPIIVFYICTQPLPFCTTYLQFQRFEWQLGYQNHYWKLCDKMKSFKLALAIKRMRNVRVANSKHVSTTISTNERNVNLYNWDYAP